MESGDTRLGGRLPVNPSGGLLSKGEPVGASALGHVYEIANQLRGRCGARQVEGARTGLTHALGAGRQLLGDGPAARVAPERHGRGPERVGPRSGDVALAGSPIPSGSSTSRSRRTSTPLWSSRRSIRSL